MQKKLRLDLFDRRYQVYTIFHDSIITALNENPQEIFDETTRKMNQKLREARYLFDANTFEYLNEIESDVLSYRYGSLKVKEQSFIQWSESQSFLNNYHETATKLLQSMRDLPKKMHPFLTVDDNLSLSLAKSSEEREAEKLQTKKIV